jgi:hypothetical protein
LVHEAIKLEIPHLVNDGRIKDRKRMLDIAPLLGRLSDTTIEKLAKELDALNDRFWNEVEQYRGRIADSDDAGDK